MAKFEYTKSIPATTLISSRFLVFVFIRVAAEADHLPMLFDGNLANYNFKILSSILLFVFLFYRANWPSQITLFQILYNM